MPSRFPRRIAGAVITLVAALGAGGAAGALAADAPDTSITVSKRMLAAAPDLSPVDFPGVSAVSAGEALPRRYVTVSRAVRITRGEEAAFAALRMTCPRGKTWRSGTGSGAITMSVLDRKVSGKNSVLVMARFDSRAVAAGDSAEGAVHALCR